MPTQTYRGFELPLILDLNFFKYIKKTYFYGNGRTKMEAKNDKATEAQQTAQNGKNCFGLIFYILNVTKTHNKADFTKYFKHSKTDPFCNILPHFWDKKSHFSNL